MANVILERIPWQRNQQLRSSLKTLERTKTIIRTGIKTTTPIGHSEALNKYIKSVSAMSSNTAYEYYSRLTGFEDFLTNSHNANLDDIVQKINEGSENPYDILSDYVTYLQTSYNISTLTIKIRIITAKNFLEYYDVDISPRKFKLKVKIPKVVRQSKEALSKEDVADILNACSDIKLKTYVMFLAATGMRATEALSIRIKDLDLKSNPVKVFVRGEYTKTKTDRTLFLTEEITQQLVSWLNYKYRTRRVCHNDTQTGKTITEIRTPDKKDTDLIFAVYQSKEAANHKNLYFEIVKSSDKTLDRCWCE